MEHNRDILMNSSKVKTRNTLFALQERGSRLIGSSYERGYKRNRPNLLAILIAFIYSVLWPQKSNSFEMQVRSHGFIGEISSLLYKMRVLCRYSLFTTQL